MSTRLSTEELEEIEAFYAGYRGERPLLLVAEVRASWQERDAARRALRDLLAVLDDEIDPLQMPDLVLVDAIAAARAVLSENPKEAS